MVSSAVSTKPTDSAVDSACSKLMTPHKVHISKLCPNHTSIRLADNSKIKSTHSGLWELPLTGQPSHSALYVPSLQEPLLSVSGLCNDGMMLLFTCDECKIFKEHAFKTDAVPLGVGERRGGLYYLSNEVQSTFLSVHAPSANMSLLSWHIALGHIGLKPLKVSLKAFDVVVSDMNEAAVTCCSICTQAKMHRLQFTTRKYHCATKKGKIVHSDVCSFEQVSREGYRYWVTFIDDYSKETFVYPMKYKSQTFQCFKHYKASFEKCCESKILRLVSDNGGEYLSKIFEDFLLSEGIQHEPGSPHSPELNGVAEWANRTLCEGVRCLLFQAELPTPFWADALRHISHTLNSVPCNTPAGFNPPNNINGLPLVN